MSNTRTGRDYEKHIDPRKRFMPPLDARIDPRDIDLSANDPIKSRLNIYAISTIPTYLVTIRHVRQQSITLYKKLGAGASATTYLAQNTQTLAWIAVKIPHDSVEQWEINEEIASLKASNNYIPNRDNTTPRIMCMKLRDGEELLNTFQRDNLHWLQRIAIFKNITKQLAFYLKDKDSLLRGKTSRTPKLHNDIQPRNILVGLDGSTSFCDFAAAAELNKREAPEITQLILEKKSRLANASVSKALQLQSEINALRKILIHSTNATDGAFEQENPIICDEFFAPELIHHKNPMRCEASEIYALGMTFAYASNFTEKTDAVVYSRYPKNLLSRCKIKENPKPGDPGHMPDALYELILRMIDRDPKKRSTTIETAIILNQILCEFGKTETLKICMISIDDFMTFSLHQRKEFFKVIADCNINAVALQGSDKTPTESYYTARYLIAEEKISLAPFIVTGKDREESLATVKEYYDGTYATLNTKVYEYHKGVLKEAAIPLKEMKPLPTKHAEKAQHRHPFHETKPRFFERHPTAAVARDALIGAVVGIIVLGIVALTLWLFAITLPAWIVIIPFGLAACGGATSVIKRCTSQKQKKTPCAQEAQKRDHIPKRNSGYLSDGKCSSSTRRRSSNYSQILIQEQFPRAREEQTNTNALRKSDVTIPIPIPNGQQEQEVILVNAQSYSYTP